MNIFDRIHARATESKTLYDLHPELQNRVPILRISSEQDAAQAPISMAEYFTTNVWVHKALRVWADNIAPLRMRVVDTLGQDVESDVNKLLMFPNDQMSPTDLWREWALNMGMMGEIGIEMVKSKSGNYYLEMWPRSGASFQVRVDSARYRRAKDYHIDDGAGTPYDLPPDQFIHSKFYNPLNVWRGLAPLSAARMGLIIDQLAQAWTRLFFRNQARPDFAVIAPEGITKTEKDDLILALDQSNTGENGLHRPIVLEQGVTDIKTFSFPPKDLEWLEQRRMGRDEIGGVFGVPDEIMGYGQDTYENFNTADRVLWTLTLINIIKLRDDGLTVFFRRVKAITPEQRIATDLSGVYQLQQSRTEQVNQFNILTGRGVPVNVASEYLGLGLPAITGGDVGYLSMGLVPVMSAAGDGKSAARLPLRKGRQALTPAYGSVQHRAIWAWHQKRIDKPVEDMQRILKREIQRQQNDVLHALRNSRTFGRGLFKDDVDRIPPAGELFDLPEEIKRFVKALKETVTDAVIQVGSSEMDDVNDGETFEGNRPAVQAGIKQILETVSKKVNETTFNDLVAIIQEAERNGEGIVKMQERLRDYFGDRKSDWQTERIARTTMTGASNFASIESWKQSGVVDGKTWISALIPDRTRDSHMDAHAQTVGLDEMFEVGDSRLAYPGDPDGPPEEIINCLCTEIPVVSA